MALDTTYDDFSFLSERVFFFFSFQKFHDCSLKQVFSTSGGWLKYVYAAHFLHCSISTAAASSTGRRFYFHQLQVQNPS